MEEDAATPDAGRHKLRETPSFAKLLTGGPPKDADVVIVEEGVTAVSKATNRKRARSKDDAAEDGTSISVPCHQVVLYSLSSFFQNKLDRWSDTEVKDSGRKQLQLLVPPGQQELGQRLIAAMYADQPQLSDLSAHQLVQLTLLAESYDVSKVVAAAARALGQTEQEQLTLEAVCAVLLLPDSCLELDCFQQVKTKAKDQLQQQFGDLEEVWADAAKAEQLLLQLPFAAMLQLVQDKRTKVASEDTIVYTLRRWLGEHPDTSSKQKEQLADTVRLPLCTATFLSSSDAIAWLLEAGYTQRELLMACLLHGSHQLEEVPGWAQQFIRERPAWQLLKRPLSSRRRDAIAWLVPLADVRGLVEQEAVEGERRLYMLEPGSIWHGRELHLVLTLDDEDDGLGLFVKEISEDVTHASLFGRLQVACTAGNPLTSFVLGGHLSDDLYGWMPMVPVPSANRDWAAVEAALRQQHLVHADGCLHLGMIVDRIE